MNNQTTERVASEAVFRALLGKWVVLVCAAGLILLSIVVLVAAAKADDGKAFEASARMVFTALLPLLGTWVGTVLAFYFSRENFEAASKSTTEHIQLALQQRLEKLMVEPNMRRRHEITAVEIPKDGDAKNVLLKTLQEKLKGRITRLPVLDHEDKLQAVVHGSVLFEFIAAKSVEGAAAGTPFDVGKATLANLLSHPRLGEIVKTTFAFVSRSSTLADAKQAMEQRAGCQDVFVTETGKASEAVLGWLTNTRIARLARL